MRDIEQIQEVEADLEDTATRKLATLLMAALATVGLVFAMGILLGRTADAVDTTQQDPLAALSELQAQAPADEDALAALPEVNTEELRFPEALEVYDRRPEVVAAIAAAAAELEHPEPLFDVPPALPVAAMDTEALPASLPAAIAAGPGSVHLANMRKEDTLLQDALPEEPARQPAPEGSDGKYTLQVASFQNPADANSFATELRTRSHAAFVTTADIPDRGRFWRVRVGPFETLGAASHYRASFEAEEQMNSYIVKKRE